MERKNKYFCGNFVLVGRIEVGACEKGWTWGPLEGKLKGYLAVTCRRDQRRSCCSSLSLNWSLAQVYKSFRVHLCQEKVEILWLVIVLRSDTVSTKSLVLILEFFRGWTIVDNVSGWTQLIQSYPTVGLRLIGNNARYNAPTKCGRISLTGHFWHLRTDLRIRKSPEVEVSLNYIKTISQFELILANRTS